MALYGLDDVIGDNSNVIRAQIVRAVRNAFAEASAEIIQVVGYPALITVRGLTHPRPALPADRAQHLTSARAKIGALGTDVEFDVIEIFIEIVVVVNFVIQIVVVLDRHKSPPAALYVQLECP